MPRDLPDLEAAKAALAHLDLEDAPAAVRAKSRDFFWYSPVLKARLDGVQADFVVSPRSEAEVVEVLRVCHAHDVPVTVRGAGTGNYGQAMPLAGGCVMHMRHMTAVKEIAPGRVVVEPGCLLKDLDAACIAHSRQEIRMFSSTWATATIGGFVAGGSGGVGSCTWGMLRDLGNIIRLRAVTMEAEPRALEFTGEALARVSHAYGTNGIITEVEMPLAPAYDWVEMFVAVGDCAAAARLALDLGHEDGILCKEIAAFEAPIAHDYFQRVRPHVEPGTSLVALMVAPHSMDGFLTFLGRQEGARLIYRSDDHDWDRAPGPVFEYGWNHTTLQRPQGGPLRSPTSRSATGATTRWRWWSGCARRSRRRSSSTWRSCASTGGASSPASASSSSPPRSGSTRSWRCTRRRARWSSTPTATRWRRPGARRWTTASSPSSARPTPRASSIPAR